MRLRVRLEIQQSEIRGGGEPGRGTDRWRERARRVATLFSGLVLAGALTAAGGASAAVLSVDDDADDATAGNGLCTLREALNNANSDGDTSAGDCTAGSGADTIELPAGTYLLLGAASDDNNASGDLDVTSEVSVNGAGADSTFIDGGGNDRVFHVLSGASLTIRDVTLQGGDAFLGGAILNATDATLNVMNSTLSGNSATDGGAIFNDGTLTVMNSTLSGNTAEFAGGIENLRSATVRNSTLSENMASEEGGGILSEDTLEVTNSTLTGNSAFFGGGIENTDLATVTNSTLSGNIADFGAGIENLGFTTLANTLVDNECEFPVESSGGNLESPGDSCGFDAATDLVDVATIDLKLEPLADNGGPTQTQALLDSSVAIDAGLDDVCAAAPVNGIDQRGEPRPAGSACDIGAYEFQLPTTTTTTTTAPATTTPTTTTPTTTTPTTTTPTTTTPTTTTTATTTTPTTTTPTTTTLPPGRNKVTVCHKGRTRQVPPPSVPAHLAHGDTLRECP